MNLLPSLGLGQTTDFAADEDVYFFNEPMVSDTGIATTMSSEGEEIPEPKFLSDPMFFLFRTYSDTKARWEMLTGLSFQTSTPEVIAEAFKRVVQKHVEKSGPQREAFGAWHGYKISEPTAPEQAAAEGQLNNASYEIGNIIEGVNPDDPQEKMMHVDYYVTVDPTLVRAGAVPGELFEGGGLSDRTKLAGAAGLVIGGLATSLLVKKGGIGLKLLAGLAGGVITAGVFMRASQVSEQKEVV